MTYSQIIREYNFLKNKKYPSKVITKLYWDLIYLLSLIFIFYSCSIDNGVITIIAISLKKFIEITKETSTICINLLWLV